MSEFSIRTATAADQPFLTEMLWRAFCWRETEPVTPGSLPEEVAKYVAGFPGDGDFGVIATAATGAQAAAAWYRFLPPENPGYGFVDAATPETTLAVRPEFRRQRVGSSLLDALLVRAASNGVEHLSLSTEPDNPAVRLYARAGFVRVGVRGGSWTMLADCAEWTRSDRSGARAR